MDIKARALSSQETSRSLNADACGTLHANMMAVMPSSMLVSRNIRNWRQGKCNALPIPQGLTGHSIPDEYKVFDNGELFLQFDSGEFDKERMLLFATQRSFREDWQTPFKLQYKIGKQIIKYLGKSFLSLERQGQER